MTASLVAALMLFDARGAGPAPIGYVSDLVGNWLQDGAKIEPHTAAPVLPGSVITLDSSDGDRTAANAFIIIYLDDGRRIERTWEKPATLHEAIHIDPAVKEVGVVSQFLSAAARLFRHAPQRYAITMSRGAHLSYLQEAVVRLDGSRSDLAPALHDTPKGEYKVQWQRLEAGATEPTGAVLTQTIDWGGKGVAIFQAAELQAGIWQVSLLTAAEDKPLDGTARVLACAPTDFARATASFAKAVNLCDSWGDAVKPPERQTFLREILDTLDATK